MGMKGNGCLVLIVLAIGNAKAINETSSCNYSCPRMEGKVCGGHGTCGCDQRCLCEEGWTGRDCSCTTNLATCMASNGSVCNGKGVCLCGSCSCFDDRYNSATCEQCPTCPTTCMRYRDCVLYKVFHRTVMDEMEFETRCPNNVFIIVGNLSGTYGHENGGAIPNVCQFVDAEDECTYYFKVAILEDGTVKTLVQQEKVCPAVAPVLSIVFGVPNAGDRFSGMPTISYWLFSISCYFMLKHF